MSFPRYPAYKPSGVEWLGEVPEHWEVQKFRHLFEESSEKIDKEAFGEMLSVSGYRGIELKQYDDENRRRRDEDLAGYRIVRPGQLVVNTMWLNYAGLGFSDLNGHVSPAYRAYWPRTDESTKYLHYLLRSDHYVKGYTRLLTGVRPNSLQMSRDNMMGFPVILPPKIEQLAITTFLDRETAKIDALIAEQQRLIELLQEKRQAVISHAVTKGLNPNVPMKDSGVEWLGEVPEHWDVTALGYVLDAVGDVDHYMPPSVAEGIPYLMTGDLQELASQIDFENCKQIASQDYERLCRKIKTSEGDLIMARYATIGTVAYVDVERDFAVSYSCVTIKADAKKVSGKHLFFYLKSDAFAQGIRQRVNANTQDNVGIGDLKSIKITIPPLNEQQDIVDHLQLQASEMERVIGISKETVRLLQERRSALISAAVTGQIDVRGLVEAEGSEL